MKTRLVSMGNSRGVRLPKPLIEQLGFEDEVELRVEDGAIVIYPVTAPRAGWAEAAARLAADSRSALLDRARPTHFDEEQWRW